MKTTDTVGVGLNGLSSKMGLSKITYLPNN